MRNILSILLVCSLVLITGASNAETVPVTAPSQYTDSNPIAAGTSITITVYKDGACGGTAYGTSNTGPGAIVNVTGPLVTCQSAAYVFSADARIAGTAGACSAPATYTYPCATTPKQPSIGNIVR